MSIENLDQHEALVVSLMDKRRWPSGGGNRRRIDTHISTVLLAGKKAFKIKKPLDLGFLDFVSLAAREEACREELRLNRRLAPDLYKAVCRITGSIERPRIDGKGPLLDWAVRMKRFDPLAVLSNQLARLSTSLIDRLGDEVARFHGLAEVAAHASDFGTYAAVAMPIEQNFRQIREYGDSDRHEEIEQLQAWSMQALDGLRETLAARKRMGCIRECHGDLHLGNVALIDGVPVIFDAIEFNPGLRWIDTINDVAFLYMDLHHHRAAGLANRFIDRYLQHTGDYAGLRLLRFYAVYRALVRAKIAAIRLGQDLAADERSAAGYELSGYLDLAGSLSQARTGGIVIMSGVSGSGKSHASEAWSNALPIIRLRSDVERKRLLGLAAGVDASSSGGYAAALTAQTYTRLAELAEEVVAAGYPAVIDATFLKAAQRDRFRDLAGRLHVPFLIVDCDAPVDVLRQRVLRRKDQHDNVSDADLDVLDRQLESREPLSDAERELSLSVRPGEVLDGHAIAARMKR